MHRRTLLAAGAATLGTAAVFALTRRLGARADGTGRYGALVPDPKGILDLPEGFRYKILEQAGEAMSDGFLVPGRLDGMACFARADGAYILMRNSEQTQSDTATSPYPHANATPPEVYDRRSIGGVSRVVVANDTLDRISSNLVLTGTERNCAGGPSPWGWLSCEESVVTPAHDAHRFTKRHGYVFLCRTEAEHVEKPQRIDGYGRLNHEAVAIDPDTHIAYLSEDRTDACFYRFVPADPADPFKGQLQALAIAGSDRLDTSNIFVSAIAVGERLPCRWVDIANPDPEEDVVRAEARQRGAALFRRSEGLWWFDGSVYIACTSGGPAGLGQLFRYHANEGGGGALELVLESSDRLLLDHPDNVTVAPWGDVFLAEDDYHTDSNLLRGLTPDGELFDFARNALNPGEFAGVCFAPDGAALFCNLYQPGVTLAVTGPFV